MEIIYLLIYGEKWEGYTVESAHATKKGPKGVDFSEIIIRGLED